MADGDQKASEPIKQSTQTDDSKKVSNSKNNNKPKLADDKIHIKLFSAYKIFFEGDAKSISAENDTGPFDVLPRHHNFISLVNACEIVINTLDNSEKRIRISKAVMHVHDNNVTVFLDV